MGSLIYPVLASVGLFLLCIYGIKSIRLFANGFTDTILDDQKNNTKRNYNSANSFIRYRLGNFQFDSEDHSCKLRVNEIKGIFYK